VQRRPAELTRIPADAIATAVKLRDQALTDPAAYDFVRGA